MNYSIKPTNHRSDEYDRYLDEHISNVQRTWNEMLIKYIQEWYPELVSVISSIVANHDASKYTDAEFDAYCNYFYPTRACPRNETAFDLAWLHHQHTNPHHWQYWVLVRDEGDAVALDMPVEYIVEMLCDWHSFSAKDPKSTAYSWYNKNKSTFIFSDNTRKLVEEMVEYLKEPLK